VRLEEIKTIGVLGGGVMGSGISQTAILAGYNVICRDLTDEIIANTKDVIVNSRFGLKAGIERGKHTQEQVDQALARLTLTTKIEDLKDVDFLIEAIGGGPSGELENKDLKLKVFAELEEIVKKDAIFASNTSRFTIADLASATKRKDKFIGMHFFSPANIMRLVEVIYTADVSPEVIDLTIELGKKLGKVPIKVKDIPGDTGFVGNRVMGAARREAMKIIEEGIATGDDINTVMTLGFNWPAGPAPSSTRVPNARTGWR
jgi:3-hydroxybutyryl-CoA dehydrogenase